MHIVYITSFFPPDRIAGAELATHFMARYMVSKGHRVDVVITRPSVPREKEERDGYNIHWLEFKQTKGLRFFNEIKAGVKKIEELKPDIVHSNCLLPGGTIATKYAKTHPCKSIVLCYGYDVTDMRFPLTIWGKAALKNSHLVMAASEYTSSKAKKWAPNINTTIFYAGYDDHVFPLNEKVQTDKIKNCLFIGRLIPEKGLDLLLEVFENLDESYHLQVIGQGELEKVYKDKCLNSSLKNRVKFLGYVPNEKLSDVLKKTHALILPSRREPFGVVCIEAIASGVPVVCSNVMGLPEAVCDGENGIVVNNFEISSWLSAIQRVCTEEKFRDEIYQKASYYHDKWKWSSRLGELENIYQSL